MFVLSTSLHKSGSSLFAWYQKELIQNHFGITAQKEFELLVRKGLINGVGHYASLKSGQTIDSLISISKRFGPFVVKTHVGLTEKIAHEIKSHNIFATIIHRDPRDVILSAIDHGDRQRKANEHHRLFAKYVSVEKAIPLVKQRCAVALHWMSSGYVEIFKYYNLLTKPETELVRFCKVVGIEPDKQFITNIINKYSNNLEKGKHQFNTGKLLRYKDEMTFEEIELCNKELGDEIIKMGYDLEYKHPE